MNKIIIIENIKSIQFYIFLPYIYIPILIKHLSTNFIDVMGLAPYKPSREEYFQSYTNIINRQDMNYSSKYTNWLHDPKLLKEYGTNGIGCINCFSRDFADPNFLFLYFKRIWEYYLDMKHLLPSGSKILVQTLYKNPNIFTESDFIETVVEPEEEFTRRMDEILQS